MHKDITLPLFLNPFLQEFADVIKVITSVFYVANSYVKGIVIYKEFKENKRSITLKIEGMWNCY